VNAGRDLAQNSLAFEGRQSPGGSEGLDCGGNGGFGVLAASLVNMREECAVVGRANVNDLTLLQPLPIQEKTVVATEPPSSRPYLTSFEPLVIRSLIRFLFRPNDSRFDRVLVQSNDMRLSEES